MKALLIPAAAAALLAGCSTWDQPPGSYYPAGYPAGSVYAPSAAPYATMGDYRYGGNPAPYVYGGNVAPYYQQTVPAARPYRNRDRDGDGIRNNRDPDKDGDGVPNVYDSRPNNPNRR